MVKVHFNKKEKGPTCIDLFCGAGGLSLGFAMAGGTPIGGVDMDEDSIQTYKQLFPMAKQVYAGLIQDWKLSALEKNPDVIIGGPPCQGFSLARGTRFIDDPRNHLYKEFIRVIKFYQPRWFVMENVPGITNIGEGIILKEILQDFEDIGYLVNYRVINMAEYGVPQTRKRAIFVGNRNGKRFCWPEPTNSQGKRNEPTLFGPGKNSFVTVNEALCSILLPQGNYFAHRANSQMRGPRNRDAYKEPAFTLRVRGDEFGLCEVPAESAFVPGPAPEGEVIFSEPQNDFQEYVQCSIPPWVEFTPNLKRATRQKLKLRGTRKLTIRESARLQSFPDWVEFTGRPYSKARQIGNAVPPLFGYHLFNAILEQ